MSFFAYTYCLKSGNVSISSSSIVVPLEGANKPHIEISTSRKGMFVFLVKHQGQPDDSDHQAVVLPVL